MIDFYSAKKIENRQTHIVKVDALGGPSQIASLLKTSATSGINSDDTADIQQRQQGTGYRLRVKILLQLSFKQG